MHTVDVRGLSCPQPVIKTKQALDKIESGVLVTIVDNEVAKKNVAKLVSKMGYTVSVQEKNNDYHLTIEKGKFQKNTEKKPIIKRDENDTIIFCMSNLFGDGDDTLGHVLMKGFFYSLTELAFPPKSIIFMNKGIFLSLNDSPILESLQELAVKGTEILSCGTCLDYYQKKESLAIGEITNMYTATESLSKAGRIIRI